MKSITRVRNVILIALIAGQCVGSTALGRSNKATENQSAKKPSVSIPSAVKAEKQKAVAASASCCTPSMNAAGGRMRLSTRCDMAERVANRFSDDGLGIVDASLKRIFDPFFTTKLGQGGDGLGLNIC